MKGIKEPIFVFSKDFMTIFNLKKYHRNLFLQELEISSLIFIFSNLRKEKVSTQFK